MSNLTRVAVLIIVLAACGGSATEVTTSTSGVVSTAAASATTTTPASATTQVPTTTPTVSAGNFALTIVSLGVLGNVVVQNVGGEAASLGGHWLCQRPSYYEFPDVVLQPGETAAVSVGGDIFVPPEGAIVIDGVAAIGPFNPESGEVALYFGSDFNNPEGILSYVEWGSSGHGRSQMAVAAQIWPEGGFVATTADSGAILATSIPATDPTDWMGG